jgi:hypothetical protein
MHLAGWKSPYYRSKAFWADILGMIVTRSKFALVELDCLKRTTEKPDGRVNNENENIKLSSSTPTPSKMQNPQSTNAQSSLANHRYFPLYLSNNERAVLYVPPAISPKDFDLLKKQIEIHLAVIQATSVTNDNEK